MVPFPLRGLAIVVTALAAITGLVTFLGLEMESSKLQILSLTADDVQKYVEAWAPWSAIVSIGLMVLHSFVPLPAEIIAVANGMMFGFVGGSLVTWTGAMLGAALSFAIARQVGRPALRWLVSDRRWRAVDKWELRPVSLLLARLIPVISFNLINYVAGLTGVGWWTFLWTTALGILPVTIASVLLGNSILQGRWAIAAIVIAGAAILLLALHHWGVQRIVSNFFVGPSAQPGNEQS